jgi:hypothetical protein
MNQHRQATSADPQAGASLATGEQYPTILTLSAHVAGLLDIGHAPLLHFDFGRVLVKSDRLSHLNAQRAGGADTQAKPGAVTQFFMQHPCLAIDDLDSAFGAWRHTHATAITQFFVNADDLASHGLMF